MSRYPFSDHIDRYLDSSSASLGSDRSVETARRRLRSMGRIFHQLKSGGVIGSDNPSSITVRDVQSYIGRRKADGVSDSTVRRDLEYLNGYLRFLDNDSAEILLSETEDHARRRYEDLSARALSAIIGKVSDRRPLSRHMEVAYSFVILVIALGIRPEQLRRSRFLVGAEPGYIMDRHIEYVDDCGNRVRKRLDLNRMPVVRRYTFGFFGSEVHSSHTNIPMFPSDSPMFDYISPNEVRSLKKEVEKDIGYRFDYRICQRLYIQMLDDDGRAEVKKVFQPMFDYHPNNRSVFGKVRDVIFRRTVHRR